MKIGDRVRFLSETGGGRVSGFKGKNIVLVEDEDGFEIPTLISEVVVVETDDYNIAKVHTSAVPDYNKKKNIPPKEDVDASADQTVTFKKPVEERKGGDALSAFLAFVPMNIKEMTTTNFESYFVNDSNYYMRFAWFVAEGNSWSLKYTDEVEPNTKLFIEEFERNALNDMERVCIQVIAYKRNKNFMIKPIVDIQFRIDPVKFYKLHTFRENVFFETPALLYTIIENDIPQRPLVIDAQHLKQQLYSKHDGAGKQAEQEGNSYVRRYDNQQSKSKATHIKTQNDKLVIDLHASEVLETTSGMSAGDILNYQLDVFKRIMEENKANKGKKIVFIHGKGEYVLKQSILQELKYRYKKCSFQDASFQEYGYGATQVTIR